MSKKVSLKSIKGLLKQKEQMKTIKKDGFVIEVKQYLPIFQKRTIIELIIQNAVQEDGKIDYYLKDIMKNYFIIKYYTNINVSDKVFEVVDLLQQTGLIDEILMNIPKQELEILDIQLEKALREEVKRKEYDKTFLGMLKKLIDEIDVDKMIESLEKFDAEKLTKLIPKHDLELLKQK